MIGKKLKESSHSLIEVLSIYLEGLNKTMKKSARRAGVLVDI
jgi:hypothetical protein